VQSLETFPPTGLSAPVGLARLVSFRWVLRSWKWLARVAVIAVVAYLIGLFTPWALLCMSVCLICLVTAASSDGSVMQGDHLVAVVVLVQFVAVVGWNAQSRWNVGLGRYVVGSQGATAAWWSIQAIVAVYFTSGLTKLLRTRGAWIDLSPGVLVSALSRLETAQAMVTARYVKRRRVELLVARLLPHPTITRLLFAGGLMCELLAPIGLLGENMLLIVGVALIALHQMNRKLLLLPCVTYQVIVLTFLVNVPRFWR
jgi:hypothetical protein